MNEDCFHALTSPYRREIIKMLKWKNMSAGIGVLYPFTPAGWGAGWKLMSERVQKKSWTYIKNNANMVVLTFSWNFNSGLKHKTEEKLMNNVDRETGIAR